MTAVDDLIEEFAEDISQHHITFTTFTVFFYLIRTFILELIAIAIICMGIVIGDSTTPGPITMIFLGLGLLSLAGISRSRPRRNNLQ